MPFPFVIWGAAALGAALAGKAIYDAVTDSDSSGGSSATIKKEGPSQEELKKEEREKIFEDFQNKFRELWRHEDQLLCLKDAESLGKCRQLLTDVRNNNILPGEAFNTLKTLEMEKENIALTRIGSPGSFIGKNFSTRYLMIENLNETLMKGFLYDFSYPKIEFADHYDLCRDEYWVKFLNDAIIEANIVELRNLPQDWRRITPVLLKQLQDVQNLEAACDEGIEPRVVVCGMLKAGKSTLLNSLFDDPTNQHFPTARTRKTRENQIEVLNGIRFIDTPGLDYESDDTEEAKKAYMGADLLLFVHDGSKELEENQFEFLKQLQEMHPDLSQKIIFVITSKLQCGSNLDALMRIISEKIIQRSGFSPEIFAVENNSYRSQKEKVKASAGIYELREAIENHCKKISVNLEKLRAERKIAAREALKKIIADVSAPVVNDRQELVKQHEEIFNSFKKMITASKEQLDRV